MLKKIGIALAALVVVAALALFALITSFKSAAQAKLDTDFTVEVSPIPVPWPLSESEMAEVREARGEQADSESEPDWESIAAQRALARGEHLLASRVGCTECHGKDLAGATVIDNPVMGKWVGPNITAGGLTKDYTIEDWTRIIRHGVKKNGKVATMPSRDFMWLSDQEISDIIYTVRQYPAVEKEMPPTVLGPIFSMLIAKGEIPIDALDTIDHKAPRRKVPPPSEDTLALGEHIATTCSGCHGLSFAGGVIPGGDPSWPPASNLTPHDSGIKSWSETDFVRAMKEGVSKDGEPIAPPMPIEYTKKMTTDEAKALYAYFMSLDGQPTGSK